MTLPQEMLGRILEKAVMAPSGDNSQPWRFQIRDTTIRILNVPEKDTSPFNHAQASNYLALGAAIENLRIAATEEGYRASVRLFPDSADETAVADIALEADAGGRDELAPYLEKRASNRRKYEGRMISEGDLQELQTAAATFGARAMFVTDKPHVATVARLVSAGEKIALENEDIHRFLFEHVTWSEEDERRRHGFYIKTFEFAPPQAAAFKLFRNWKILKALHPLGIADFIAKDMESVYRSSAAFGALIMPDRSRDTLVKAGRALERLWLTATKLGLSMQATTSVHLLALPLDDGATAGLSEAHQELVRERYPLLKEAFGAASNEWILFAFRIGYAAAPSGRTTRAAPSIEAGPF